MIGKLNPQQLKDNVLALINKRRSEVILGAAPAEDCAAIKSDKLILLTTDPITASDVHCAKSAIDICCNDLAASGAEPVGVLLTIILPPTCTEQDVKELMTEAEKTAKLLNVDIIGGHTEFSDAVNRIVVCATAVGTAEKIISSSSAQEGDSIIVTKYLALEGTAILAARLEKMLSLQQINEAKNLFEQTSVVKEGLIARRLPITTMHDITEGGIFGAVCEVAAASGLGASLNCEDMPFLTVTDQICTQLGVDKYKLISSGSMLITTACPQEVVQQLEKHGIKATVIGKMTKGQTIAKLGGKAFEISVQPDEIGRIAALKGE